MAGNSFGTLFNITTFGESHGTAIGVIIDGCPAGLPLEAADIQFDLDRRRPGQSHLVTQRKEADTVEILSGVFEGKSTGTPITLLINNKDAKSKDYAHIKDTYRPSHADYVYDKKYGHRDYRGGGRSSARETATRVAAGAIAKKLIQDAGIKIFAFVDQIGDIKFNADYNNIDLDYIESNPLRIPDADLFNSSEALIKKIRSEGDTIGGAVRCIIQNTPVGLGRPVFDRLHADLAKAMMSINASRGFEIGSGFDSISMRGSKHNDQFFIEDGRIQGGISNGMDIYFRVAFKPVATLIQVSGKGRHDPCVVPRAVPIVEAMAALVMADHLLLQRSDQV
ncbi:UNVERIFIED_CONTAM: hypothetical protein GTU68_041796 [Idotea baltica]|nr:hypothetical protein [Idotea baltica]